MNIFQQTCAAVQRPDDTARRGETFSAGLRAYSASGRRLVKVGEIFLRWSLGVAAVSALAGCAHLKSGDELQVASPDGDTIAYFSMVDGSPGYRLEWRGKEVLERSQLGVQLSTQALHKGLRLQSVSVARAIDDSYTLRHGKQRDIHYQATERAFTLATANGDPQLTIRFRVSDDGLAFRYEFLGESSQAVTLEREFTSFNFPASARGWLQHVALAQTGWNNTNPSYEEHYQLGIPVDQSAPSPAGWAFPALFNSAGAWLAITEAGMTGNFHASRLQAQSPRGEYKIGYPMAAEVATGGELMASDTLPFHSPWRIIAVGTLSELTASTLGTDLAPPAIAPMPFAEPGLVSWSWALLKDESVNFETQKQFIDYAAEMGWPYTLVDADWDQRIGEQRIQTLADYAASKNVGLHLWYNSSGDWNETPLTPKSRLLDTQSRRREFAKLQSWGIRGIKVDFFAGDGKSMMAYYNDLARDAADFDLMLNYHGSSLPRGMSRTYPNLMTMEAVHGFEMITFMQNSADKAPAFITVLPFARNLFDPMDFTPTTFNPIDERERRTTNGFELALPVLLLSGLQHIAETPEGMAKVPQYVKELMKDIPVSFDESRLVRGYPGKDVVIARRAGDTWFVAGVNGEDSARAWSLDLSFIDTDGVLVGDGDRPFSFSRKSLTPNAETRVEVQGYGGFLMVFKQSTGGSEAADEHRL